MKNLTLILSGFLLLTLGSCKKEEINPISEAPTENQEDPQDFSLRSANNNNDDNQNEDRNPQDSPNGVINDWTEYTRTTDSIFVTDPNRDEDEERKEKRK